MIDFDVPAAEVVLPEDRRPLMPEGWEMLESCRKEAAARAEEEKKRVAVRVDMLYGMRVLMPGSSSSYAALSAQMTETQERIAAEVLQQYGNPLNNGMQGLANQITNQAYLTGLASQQNQQAWATDAGGAGGAGGGINPLYGGGGMGSNIFTPPGGWSGGFT